MSCLLLLDGAPKGNRTTENIDRSEFLASIASSDFTAYSSIANILSIVHISLVDYTTLLTYASTAPPTPEPNFASLRPASFADDTNSSNEEDRASLLGKLDHLT